MTKLEIAGYLVNLQSIMEGKEDAGLARGKTLAAEYEKHYSQLVETIRKEQEDETGKSRS